MAETNDFSTQFDGAVAFVAGAGGGIGLNIANDLIKAGAHVALADVKAMPDTISTGPGRHRYFVGDLTEESFVKDAINAIVEDFGRIDYLVNTIGVLWFDRDKSLLDIDLEVWDRIFRINLKSIVITTRCVIPHMIKARRGAMVHFSSVDALSGDPEPQDAYGASKAAIIRLSKSIAVQFGRHGIRSNTILPGATISPMQARWEGNDELVDAIAGGVPLKRLGTTQDQTNACLFLLSDYASYITGTELIVDGGRTAVPA